MDVVDHDYQLYVHRSLNRRTVVDRSNPIEEFNEEEFVARYRLSKDIFMHVLGTISHDINSGLIPPPPLLKFATCLRYYATGSTQLIHADLHGISQPMVSRIVRDVSAALASLRKTHIYFPADIQGKRNVCAKFSDEIRINNVIGAIDCTHISVIPPKESAAAFYNRKQNFSINVQVVCDSDGIVQNIVARWPGSTHDARIFSNSKLKRRLEDGDLRNFILLGDSGYALTENLLTPVSNPQTRAQEDYNLHFIRTRLVIERTFGVIKKVFACIGNRNKLATKLSTSTATIIAVFVLHNIRVRGNMNTEITDRDHDLHAFDTGLGGSNAHNSNGRVLRRTLIERYFNV